ncbi:ATP-binding protein [Halioxenophilus aromaticivorans]|uniref:histidine kinase n=1 Tax=Halioxenophilus aromaticivorans TaxID=1306992 RepID=A0AAV3U4R9_9ALTE
MRLRKQLSLLALLFLLMPVAGFLFVREIEQLLRLGQEQALMASAQAVADRIHADEALLADIERANPDQSTGQPLYVFADSAAITLDGYDDDWRFLKLRSQQFNNAASPWQITLIHQGAAVVGFLTVSDSAFEFHDPRVAFPASGDFVALYDQQDASSGLLVFRTSAPGEMQSVYLATGQEPEILHTARAVWRELPAGFQIEFSVPERFFRGGVTLGVYDSQNRQWASNMGNAEINAEQLFTQLLRWPVRKAVLQNEALQNASSIFTHSGQRLRVVNNSQRVLADANRLHDVTSQAPPMAWLVQRIINDEPLQSVEREYRVGQLHAPEVERAIAQGEPTSHWYQWNQSSNLVRVSVPIKNPENQQLIGAVIAEQTTHQWLALADRAFKRLLMYSLLVMAVLTLALFAYATWLSVRIQRLSRAADNAIDEDGSINVDFPKAKIHDEIGDLNCRFGQLLQRVGEYNEYLKTLASKLSHELRTPLAIVKSSLDNLESETDNTEVYLARAKQGTDRLSSILNAMNSARRIEDAINHADFEAIDLAALLHDVSQAYAATYPSANSDKSFSIHSAVPATPVWVMAAPDLIVQMLDKLFENAVDFCNDQGEIQFSIRQQGKLAKLTVANTGPNLPSNMSGQLFSSMVSVRDANQAQPHLGLGLHIVKLIVDFHQGHVSARNCTEYSGVAFEITLPLGEEPDSRQ